MIASKDYCVLFALLKAKLSRLYVAIKIAVKLENANSKKLFSLQKLSFSFNNNL